MYFTVFEKKTVAGVYAFRLILYIFLEFSAYKKNEFQKTHLLL